MSETLSQRPTPPAAEDRRPLEGLPLGAVVRYDIPLRLAARALEGPCECWAEWGHDCALHSVSLLACCWLQCAPLVLASQVQTGRLVHAGGYSSPSIAVPHLPCPAAFSDVWLRDRLLMLCHLSVAPLMRGALSHLGSMQAALAGLRAIAG